MKMNYLLSASVRRGLVPSLWAGSAALYVSAAIYVIRVTEVWHRLNNEDNHFLTMPIWLILPLLMTGSFARQVKSLESLEKNAELRRMVSLGLAAVVFLCYVALLIGLIVLLRQVPQFSNPLPVNDS
jgi:hypothetical protein